MNQLGIGEEVRGWQVRLVPRQGKPFLAACTIAVVRDSQDEAVGLHWLLQDITALER